MIRKFGLLTVTLLIALLSLASSLVLFPRAHPLGGLHTLLSREEALERGSAIMKDLGLAGREYKTKVQIGVNDQVTRDLYAREGIASGNLKLRESAPGFLWVFTGIPAESPTMGRREPPGGRAGGGGSELPFGEVEVRLDMRGALLAVSVATPDTLALPSVDSAAAAGLARALLSTRSALRGVHFNRERRIELPNRLDRELTLVATDTVSGEQVEASVRIVGNAVGQLAINRPVAPPVETGEGGVVRYVVIVFLYLGIGVVIVVAAIRRIRAYEIGFRYAYVLGACIALLQAIARAASMESFDGWNSILDLTLVPFLVGGAFTVLWAVAESISRETFREKFLSLDLVTNGYPLHSRVGEDLLRGIAGGMAAVAFSLAVAWAGEQVFSVWFATQRHSALSVLSSGNPLLAGFSGRLLTALFLLAFLVMAFLGLLKKRVRSTALLTLAGAVVVGIPNGLEMRPEWTGVVVGVLSALLLVWVLLRSSFVAGAVAMCIWHVSDPALAFLLSGHPAFVSTGTGFLEVGAGLFLIGTLSVLTRDRAVDFDRLAPDFARHITERERLQQELEVARKVQMSFLPKKDPVVPGLDIASRCVPALEVGGDYYDYVPLGEDALGVVVGDVSGKGLQASFYMTLAKGFLRAVARGMRSPASVLKGANDLFSENVEKGTFISMVYGIVDLRGRTFTFARAGHSLVILKRGDSPDADLLRSSGMALGLERSDQFAETLEEVRLEMRSGDLVIVYTDGFTEAMDGAREEFGEERLLSAVRAHASGTAREILDGVFGDVKKFIRKQEQHDDMTIVVIKWT